MQNLPTSNGLAWRPAEQSDVSLLAAHTKRVHGSEKLSFLPGESFFSWLLEQPGLELEDNTRVAIHDGTIVADTGAWLHTSEVGARCIIWAEASPGYEHLKAPMFAWARDRARVRLDGADPMQPRVVRTTVEEHRVDHIGVIEAAGFQTRRSFAEMARPLTDLPDPPALPEDIDVVPWSDEFQESVRLASNDSFADHWGSLPMSAEEFAALYVQGSPTFRPDLSFLAVTGDDVVSFSMCEVDDEDNADRETDDVYIHRVGTKRTHRGQRLATHLIVRSMQAAVEAGLDRAALEVDEMSHTNATAVYERLGFETHSRSLNFFDEIPVIDG